MKRLMTLILAAGMVFGAAFTSQAVEFKAKGQWLAGFDGGQGSLLDKTRTDNKSSRADNSDKFSAAQRIRLQLDAVASESLSGTVFFEIGDTTWGRAEHGTVGQGSGGALGSDGVSVEVKRAYIDWMVPETDLSARMGLQGMAMPNAAGGSAVLDDDVAAVSLSAHFNENVGLTGFWARPYNDNYVGQTDSGNDHSRYLDNFDLFSLAMPLHFDGADLTPWLMYGVIGQNTFRHGATWGATTDATPFVTSGYTDGRWRTSRSFSRNSSANTGAFWGGLPARLTLWDPLNIEFDVNYGFVDSMGRGDITRFDGMGKTRYDTRREGWLAKALVEYKLDWGTPGLFGWYASGDDDNPKNGSERMPAVSPKANFTSFLGDANMGWSANRALYDRDLSCAGTWGIGGQIADMNFLDNLKHTFRVAWRGGTNSPSMARYASHPWGWGSGYETAGSQSPEVYLTTNDGLLEFNLANNYKMYDNFDVNLELGYVVNLIDQSTWKKANRAEGFDRQDAWKAQLNFAYSF